MFDAVSAPTHAMGGLVLMIGPYFSGGAPGTWLLAAGVGALVWGATRLGW